MGLLRRVLFAPVTAPAATTVWLARQLQARANEELNDPVAIRAALATLEAHLGFALQLPHANASGRSGAWQDLYTVPMVQAVAEACADDIARFEYRFG